MSVEINLKHVWTPVTKMTPEVISWRAGTRDDTQTHAVHKHTNTYCQVPHKYPSDLLPYHAEVTECTGGDEPI